MVWLRQDEKFAVFADRSPGSDIHLLLIPKRHIGTSNSLSSPQDSLVDFFSTTGNVKDLKRKDVPMGKPFEVQGLSIDFSRFR